LKEFTTGCIAAQFKIFNYYYFFQEFSNDLTLPIEVGATPYGVV
jgi:hypothetical protein